MRPFEYARPQNESEALDLLNDHDANTAVLAGGTDLIALLQEDLQAPQRVVDIKQVESMQGIAADGDGELFVLVEVKARVFDLQIGWQQSGPERDARKTHLPVQIRQSPCSD